MSCKKMNVAFGVTVLGSGITEGKLDGIGYYAQELGTCLYKSGVRLTPVAFGTTGMDRFAGEYVQRLPRYAYTAAFSAVTSVACLESGDLRGKVDLFHSTDHCIPKLNGIPQVATIMDAIPLAHPEWANQCLRTIKNTLWRATVRWADHILTISEYSKTQLIEHFNLHPDKISVVPLGVADRYFERLPAEIVAACLLRYDLPDKFFLFIGTLQPRKNIKGLIRAHAMLPKEIRETVPLVVVGRSGWGSECWKQLLEYDAVRWIQGVNDLEKRALLQSATILTFPSLCEGFGLPVLEAFASGLPVISSNAASLPEVVGNAAELIDPMDSAVWAEAMERLISNGGLRRKYGILGRQRAKNFSWEECAQATHNVYCRVLK